MPSWKDLKVVIKGKNERTEKMSFDDLATDTMKVLKKNGEIFPNIKSVVEPDKIFILRSDILIETGDVIHRTMSNGGEETYRVIDPGFHEKFGEIPAGYQLDVIKLGRPQAEAAVQNITYNISGTNSRINQNSTDNSVNITNLNSELREHVEKLRNEIEKLGLPNEKATTSYEVIDAVEEQISSEKPSKAVVQTLLDSLPNAGSIASIGSLIVSLLT